MLKYTSLLAHYDQNYPERAQPLIEHLLNVAFRARDLGSIIGLGSICQLIGLLHDFGKHYKDFQAYLRGNNCVGRVTHSTIGGVMLDYIKGQVDENYDIARLVKSEGLCEDVWQLYNEVLMYPILAHHGLYDIIDQDFEYRTGLRLKSEKITSEDLEFLDVLNRVLKQKEEKSFVALYYEGFLEFIKIYKEISDLAPQVNYSSTKEKRICRMKALHFYYGALVRLLLSILKEADIYDSANYYLEHKNKIYSREELNDLWFTMGESVKSLYRKFEQKVDKSSLDVMRTKLANEIYDFSKTKVQGVFKLNLPVGAGKTFAGLRYLIGNARQFQKNRIFYCTAFLSVLEQNAAEIRKVLGDDHVLEHHSNLIEDYEIDQVAENERNYRPQEYIKESWEMPVILTTLVQFSDTLFKHRATNIRRFSKLINSVVLIDEIQSLPIKAMFNFNLMTNFLARIMKCTIVHCTATSPHLDNTDVLKYPCFYEGSLCRPQTMKALSKAKVFSRVNYYSLMGKNLDNYLSNLEIVEHVKKQLKKEMSVLIVLNTKATVANLYRALNTDSELIEEGVEIIYLTTNQCPFHRLELINRLKERLVKLRKGKGGTKLICVSTKLVEAGVDFDFDVVYRALAGIDSVIQCGGRCNREGKKETPGSLFVLQLIEENLKYLPEIRRQKEAAKTALTLLPIKDVGDNKINIEKAADYYFQKLYLNITAQSRCLEYPFGIDETIFNLLTNNPQMCKEYENKHGVKVNFKLRQSFKTAALEFDLIKENTISVIVQYKNEHLLEKLYQFIESGNYYGIKKILNSLQSYTLNIRRTAVDENYISKELNGELFILDREAYDERVGLTKAELQTLIF